MNITRREAVLGTVALALTGLGEMAYHLVSPVDPSMDAKTAVASATADLSAMKLASWLDLGIMFYTPALIVLGLVAGARSGRLAWVGTVIGGVAALIGTGYLFASDVLVVEAAKGKLSVDGYDAYLNNPVVSTAVPIYLVGFVLAMVLLGIALARSGSVPTWAGVLLPISVVVGVIGSGAGVTLVIVLGDLMLLAVFATCAKAMFASAVSSHEAFEPVRA